MACMCTEAQPIFILDGSMVHGKRTKSYILQMNFSKRHISLLIHLLFDLRIGSILPHVRSKRNIKNVHPSSMMSSIKGLGGPTKRDEDGVDASEKESKTEMWSRGQMLNSQGCPLSEVLGSTSQGGKV